MAFILIQATTVDGNLEHPSYAKFDTIDEAQCNMRERFDEAFASAVDGLSDEELSAFKQGCEFAFGKFDGRFWYENHEYIWDIYQE